MYHKPLRQRAVIKQAVIQTLRAEDGSVAECADLFAASLFYCNTLARYIKRDTFPALLVNFVACMRAWIMFDAMNQTEEGVGLKDKRIEFEEFKDGVMKLSHTITLDMVNSEWASVDSDGKGMVLFNEFSDWYQAKYTSGWFDQVRPVLRSLSFCNIWFDQLRLERACQEAQKSAADQLTAQTAKASRKAKEKEEASNLKTSVLMTPFNWADGASKAQAKMNVALEEHVCDVFKSGQDGVANVGVNKLWLALDNNGNGIIDEYPIIVTTYH